MANSKVGTVVSNKMQKTIVVEIERKVKHPLYKKMMKKTSGFKVHDDIGVAIGQKVKIVESKRYAKDVHYKVAEVLK